MSDSSKKLTKEKNKESKNEKKNETEQKTKKQMIKTGHLANHENLGWRRNNGWGGGAYTCMQLFVFVLFLGVFFSNIY